MIPQKRAHLAVAAITHAGMSGKNNEDRYAIHAYVLGEDDPTPAVFAIVADGIGGHQAGEIAAEMVVETICEAITQSDGRMPLNTLNEAIIRSGQAVHAQSRSNQAQSGMGSTCACAWVIGNRLYTASVGDSRIYLLREGVIRQITIDHTWIKEAIDHGIITPDQARGHPQAHVIRRYLGSKKPTKVDFRLLLAEGESDEEAIAHQGMQLQPGDRLILCSDGLTDLVGDAEILQILLENELDPALQHLVDLANQRGGHDNITIVALQVPAAPTAPAKPKALPWLGWLIAALVTVLVIAGITALAFFAWQFKQSQPTPTLTSLSTLPAIVETSLPPSATIYPTATPSPSPQATPIMATYTPWPTSTP